MTLMRNVNSIVVKYLSLHLFTLISRLKVAFVTLKFMRIMTLKYFEIYKVLQMFCRSATNTFGFIKFQQELVSYKSISFTPQSQCYRLINDIFLLYHAYDIYFSRLC